MRALWVAAIVLGLLAVSGQAEPTGDERCCLNDAGAIVASSPTVVRTAPAGGHPARRLELRDGHVAFVVPERPAAGEPARTLRIAPHLPLVASRGAWTTRASSRGPPDRG